MLLRPTRDDVRVIAHATGSALVALGAGTALLAGVAAFVFQDTNSAAALAIGAAVGAGIGSGLQHRAWTRQPLSWTRGVVTVTLSWLVASLPAAIPLYLSGHYGGYFDAYFEALSGLTTSGLTLVQDLDHLPVSIALYRNGLELAGGLAIVVTGLMLLTAATATASSLSAGDVRDERVLPSPERTWRQVGGVATAILVPGVLAASAAVAIAGVGGWRAVEHGVSLALAAATTGGFARTSASVGYYHSAVVEVVLVPLMIAGALSFALHRAAARGDRSGVAQDFEIRTLAVSMTAIMAAVLLGLGRAGSHTDVVPLIRNGVFTAISAHTTTGLQVVTPRLLATDWGQLAPAALVAAMAIGGTTASSAGGLKTLRVGILLKGLVADVRRVLLPDSALVVSSFHWGRRRLLQHAHIRSAATLLLITLAGVLTMSTVILFVDGTVALTEALFLAMSAVSNSGLTLGTFGPETAPVLKVGLMSLMLLGRLEWIAVFATMGFLYAGLRGRA